MTINFPSFKGDAFIFDNKTYISKDSLIEYLLIVAESNKELEIVFQKFAQTVVTSTLTTV